MANFVILGSVEDPTHLGEILNEIQDIEGVCEVKRLERTGGRSYDLLITGVREDRNAIVGIRDRIGTIPGVVETQTHVALK